MPRGVLTATAPAGGSMEADEGDGNVIPRSGRKMEVLQWNALSPAVLVKLLFLLDNGDVTSQHTDYSDNYHVSAPEEARDAFLSVLRDRQHSFAPVMEELKDRVQHLMEYPFISLSARTLAADRCVRKEDEDLMTFMHVCRHLHVEYRLLEEKIKNVQKKLSITEEEMEGNLFIYAENLRMLGLCDVLTARQVAQLLSVIEEDPTLWECVAAGLEVSAATLDHTEGLKEALFFYLIRTLELNNKLNRIYTNKLEALLEQLQDQTASEAERLVLSQAINRLSDYPGGGRPAGYCVVFCDTRGRRGAQADIEKVKNVFGRSLGYTVNIVDNTNKDKLEECLRTLRKPKYKFYDSIVLWFLPRGLASEISSEMDTIDSFSKTSSFRKTPKLYFMAPFSWYGDYPYEQAHSGRVTPPFLKLAEDNLDITAVYYQMDRLVARATFSGQDACCLPDRGSVYVGTVCRLMERYRGHNITQVLERVANTIHQIPSSYNKMFPWGREDERECSYESTLQKIFRIP